MVHDGWRVVDDDDYNQLVGEPQAEGVMSTTASLSYKEEKANTTEGDACKLRDSSG
jgi:hypothetical protein